MKHANSLLHSVCCFVCMFLLLTSKTNGQQQKLQMPYKKEGLTSKQAAAHLLSRLTFGARPNDVDEVINSVGLDEKRGALIRTLSGGQRRRLDVGLGIIGSPELLFLDEPTTGFDPEARRAFWALIQSLRKGGTTILLTTHYLDEAEALADRVAVITRGKILEVSTPTQLGGRASAKARIQWKSDGVIHEELSDNPTDVVRRLASQFPGEIPELQVVRPSLEDIYLSMIGEK